MKGMPEERAVTLALYTIQNHSTVRKTAKEFNISKSTVHKDISERLPHISTLLYDKCREILDCNKAERHIRGGNATKEKYLNNEIKKS